MLLEPSTLLPGVYTPGHYGGLNNRMAEPFSSTMYLDVSRVFLSAWVVYFGSPSDTHSDGGSQFIPRALVSTDKNSGYAGSLQLTIIGVVQTCHWWLNAALRAVFSVGNWVDHCVEATWGVCLLPKRIMGQWGCLAPWHLHIWSHSTTWNHIASAPFMFTPFLISILFVTTFVFGVSPGWHNSLSITVNCQ